MHVSQFMGHHSHWHRCTFGGNVLEEVDSKLSEGTGWWVESIAKIEDRQERFWYLKAECEYESDKRVL